MGGNSPFSRRRVAAVANLGILAASAGLALVTGVVLLAVAGWRARRIEARADEQRAHALRVLLKRMTTVSAGCGGGAAGLAIAWTISQPAGSVADGFLTGAVAMGCAVFPVMAARRPVIAAYARVRGVQAGAFRSYRIQAAMAIRMAVLLWPLLVAVAISAPVWVGAVVIIAGELVAAPLLIGVLAPVIARLAGEDRLDGPVQARLSRLAADAGVRVHGRVMRARARKVANAMSLGWLPGLHYVVITDYLLDMLTEAEADAVLAHELGHARHRDSLVRQLLMFTFLVPPGLFLAGLAARAPGGYQTAVFAVFAVFVLTYRRLAGALAIRQELAADDLAARLVGPAAVSAALTRLTGLNAIKADTSKRWDRTVGHPGMDIRTARLATALHQPSPLGEATVAPAEN
jgi:Zn-dependent protease with chaperone function